MPSSEEALKQAEGLDLSTNSSNSTSAFPKAASTHIALHSLANGQSHTPKRDRYVPRFANNPHRDDVFVLCGTGTRTLPSGGCFRAFNSTRAHRNTAALHVALHPGANGSRAFGFGPFWQDAPGCLQKGEWRQQAAACKPGFLHGDRAKLAASAQEAVHVWRKRRVLYAPRLCWLLMGLSPSSSARLFEWISSFTKADSADDHVPLYPKGSQAPSSQ